MADKGIRNRQRRIRGLMAIKTIGSGPDERIPLHKSLHRHIGKRTGPHFIPAKRKLSWWDRGRRASRCPGGATENVVLSGIARDQSAPDAVIDRNDLRIRRRGTCIDGVGRNVRTRAPGFHRQDIAGADRVARRGNDITRREIKRLSHLVIRPCGSIGAKYPAPAGIDGNEGGCIEWPRSFHRDRPHCRRHGYRSWPAARCPSHSAPPSIGSPF